MRSPQWPALGASAHNPSLKVQNRNALLEMRWENHESDSGSVLPPHYLLDSLNFVKNDYVRSPWDNFGRSFQ
jgi:hypothetical protein